METQEQAKESFYSYAKNYIMKVENDDGGFNRCILFSTPSSSEGYFRIITAPGTLVVTGDYGDFIFSRRGDAIHLFEGIDREPNFHYLKEKVVAGETEKFSCDVFLEGVFGEFKDWAKDNDLPSSSAEELMKEFKNQSSSCIDNEQSAFQAWYDFDSPNPDFTPGYDLEIRYESLTFHYMWCCYAVQWAVNQYMSSKKK